MSWVPRLRISYLTNLSALNCWQWILGSQVYESAGVRCRRFIVRLAVVYDRIGYGTCSAQRQELAICFQGRILQVKRGVFYRVDSTIPVETTTTGYHLHTRKPVAVRQVQRTSSFPVVTIAPAVEKYWLWHLAAKNWDSVSVQAAVAIWADMQKLSCVMQPDVHVKKPRVVKIILESLT